MTARTIYPIAEAGPMHASSYSLVARGAALKMRLATWVRTCADYYEAAGLYDQLSRLSDSELARRGLSRATLANDVCAACDSAPAR
jgi:hypothetical protein